MQDAVEGKLFGIGSESYVVGSHEFYLGYALKNDMMLCIDMGHFHPTESVADKISPILLFSRELLLHVSRGRALGQRPRGHPQRRGEGRGRGGGPRGRLGPGARGHRLFRREHQPGGRLGDRRPRHAQGNPPGAPRADRDAEGGRGLGEPHRPSGPHGRGQGPALRRGVGPLLRAAGRARRSGMAGPGDRIRAHRALAKRR